jgi:hypothetical protein
MIDPADQETYFRAVEEEFLRRRGAPLLLSPRDWTLVGEWREQGIPLRLVIQAIDTVFDAFDSRPAAAAGRRINGLGYFRQEVQTLFDLYRTLHAVEAGRPAGGASPPAPGGSAPVVRHLGRLARQVGQAMRAASAAGRDRLVPRLAQVAAGIKVLKRDLRGGAPADVPIEARLAGLDAGLLAAVRAGLPEAEVTAIEAEAAARLEGERARMSGSAWETTRRALIARLLRRAAGVPRLTLFD